MPREDYGLSLYKIWSRFYFLPSKEILSTCHMCGAPAYIIEPKLQKGGSCIPNWAPCSHHGVFLGFIRIHFHMVGIFLVLNTWSIYPHLHVVFYDMFTIIASAYNEEVVPKIWTIMITNPNACFHVSLDKYTNPTLAIEWLSLEEVQEREATRCQ